MNSQRLKGIIRGRGKTQSDVAIAIGMSLCAFNKKINDIAEFRLSELQSIISYLEMTPQEVNDIFFVHKVS